MVATMYSSGDNLCMIIWVSKMMKPERRKEQLSMLSSTYITKFFCENNATVTVVLPYTFQVNLEGHNKKANTLCVMSSKFAKASTTKHTITAGLDI